MLPVFVVNLDRRPDRWAAISAHLHSLGIAPQRIRAVDGHDLASREQSSKRVLRRAMGYGDEACAYSHRAALNALLISEYPAALILEDDVELAPDVPAMLESTEWWPSRSGLLKLEANGDIRTLMGPDRGSTPGGRRLREIVQWRWGAGAYLINRESAFEILNEAAEPVMQIDRMLFGMKDSALARRLRPLQVQPGAARQRRDEFGSDTDPTRIPTECWKAGRRTTLSGLRRAPYNFRVLWGRISGKILRERLFFQNDLDAKSN